MQLSNSGVSEFVLSPAERRQRQDVLTALATLQAAVSELQNRSDDHQPNLRCREILQQSGKAIGTLKTFVDRQFES
jgi:hypothetical protein